MITSPLAPARALRVLRRECALGLAHLSEDELRQLETALARQLEDGDELVVDVGSE